MKKIFAVIIACLAVLPQFAQAEETKPIQLALFDPIQLVPASDSIRGLRLTVFYTANKDVSGLSLAMGVNRATGDVNGVEIGLANWVEGSAYGGQLGFVNHAGKRFVGMQWGAVNVTEGDSTGLQLGFINWADQYTNAVQLGAVNISKRGSVGGEIGIVNYNESSLDGFQAGIFNYAGEMHGLQLGLINYTKSLNGLQIGLGNYNGNKKPMEFMVLANWSF